MSPDRQRVLPNCSLKPYSRPTTPSCNTPASGTELSSSNLAQQETLNTTIINSKPGFPTYAQYKQIETAYLMTMPPKRREKALISQNVFDRIWAVLETPDLIVESPQFRFWARKMFTFGKLKSSQQDEDSQDAPAGQDTEADADDSQVVLLHEKTLVAVQEQIYDILCYSHGVTGHAGRDKTCMAVRQHYTWIPKDLVAKFIKACPTCIVKRCGMPITSSVDVSTQTALPSLGHYLHNLGGDSDSGDERNLAAEGVLFAQDLACVADAPLNNIDTTPVTAPLNRQVNYSAPASTPRSLPMAREVSLYQGIPNGWQFRHDDLSKAHEEFIRNRASPDMSEGVTAGARVGRPRVPSIAPMTRAFTMPLPADNGTLSTPLQTNVHNAKLPSSPLTIIPQVSGQSQNSILSPPESNPSHPALHLSTSLISSMRSGSNSGDSTISTDADSDTSTPLMTPASIVRPTAPLSINLASLSSQKTIQTFLTLRDTHSLTPDENMQPSPVSPSGSEYSQLCSAPMVAQGSESPPQTALPTPVDAVGMNAGRALVMGDMVAKELVEKAGSMMLSISTEAVCDHGPGVIVM
ncbi:hypothetical protein H0H81_002376 [Sphagnurus paluster]|uniref:Integrase zinc-binding domain-containing protein n=1 Tax=Sphagnurus paluster TaxID=117069 RepID=A0A9P7FM89_9AGAR|nr:hypothetical protein H0H81_002376 [Sphagnurus paluster]